MTDDPHVLAQALIRYGRHDHGCPADTLTDPTCICGLTPLAVRAKALDLARR